MFQFLSAIYTTNQFVAFVTWPYLAESVIVRRTADVEGRRHLRSSIHHDACCPVSAAINSW